MKKTQYIELTVPEKPYSDLTEEEQEKRMEAAWKELRQKKHALGLPMMVGNKLELPNGSIVPFDSVYKREKWTSDCI